MVKLDENTKLDLKVNNAWAIAVSLVLFGFSAAMMYNRLDKIEQKVDFIATTVTEMKQVNEKHTSSLNDLWTNVISFSVKLNTPLIKGTR